MFLNQNLALYIKLIKVLYKRVFSSNSKSHIFPQIKQKKFYQWTIIWLTPKILPYMKMKTKNDLKTLSLFVWEFTQDPIQIIPRKYCNTTYLKSK